MFAAAATPFGPGDSPTIVNSGDRELDYALAQTLSRLTDTWNVLPGFAYFDDSAAPNAFATSRATSRRAATARCFLAAACSMSCLKMREHPDVVVSAVCAHEFGHIAQYKYGLTQAARRRAGDGEAHRTSRRFSCRLFRRRAQAGTAGLSGRRLCHDAILLRRLPHRQRAPPRPAGRARGGDRQGIRDRVPRPPLTHRGAADRHEIRRRR